MARSLRPKAIISNITAQKKSRKDIERQISQLAVDLKWAQVITKKRRSLRFRPQAGSSSKPGAWNGRTRATRASKLLEDADSGRGSDGVDENLDILPTPPAEYPQETGTECSICELTVPAYETVELPCSHVHCQDCLLANYETTLKFPTGFPPRCCQPLDFRSTAFVLSLEQIEEFLSVKARHESTRIIPCVYCKKELLEATTLISDLAAYCSSCNRLTCTTCRDQMHKDVCPKSQGAQEFEKTAERAKWVRCPKCNRVIEKDGGCNHIQCICGSSFCSKCGLLVRLSDGAGCGCIQGVLSKKIAFGDSVQFSSEAAAAPAQYEYKKLLLAHKNGALKNLKSFTDLGRVIVAAKNKREKSLRMIDEIANLRAQLEELKKPTRAKRTTTAPEEATKQMTKGLSGLDKDEPIKDVATIQAPGNPAPEKASRSNHSKIQLPQQKIADSNSRSAPPRAVKGKKVSMLNRGSSSADPIVFSDSEANPS
ncbi:hypothetical protein TWF718_002181 [Orbilia javanica]|uniref:RING-type domain-containing protein n=1 Tax=Orbilia javanica TaxID=47235 RepID=A0AAN8NLT7_9PEZI